MVRHLTRRRLSRAVIAKWLAICLIAVTLFGFRGDDITLSRTQEVSAEFTYDLVGWHLGNFHSKWTHRLLSLIRGLDLTETERLEIVVLYFDLGEEIRKLTDQVRLASADGDSDEVVQELEGRLRQLRRSRASIRNDVEEVLESETSTVVREQRLGLVGKVVIPPVDVRLEEPPMVLVTSPRQRIQRLDDVLLEASMTVQAREAIEEQVSVEQELSALVLEIGGVATYPASVHNGLDLRSTLRLTAHEWVHHYLFLKPLGRSPYRNADLMALNETVASIAGDEIGDLAYSAIESRMDPTPDIEQEAFPVIHVADLAEHTELDLGSLMRETRITVEKLLAEGEVDRAEDYMEDQRNLLTRNGHPIRKLNQAYFAFYGTYAHGPASIDPIGPRIQRLRELSADVGEFLTLSGSIASSEELLELLRLLETAGGTH